jgi:hypothetical protein
MAVIRFACPECQSVLKSGNPIALGTKIKCPKCSHVFALSREVKETALEAEAVAAPSRKRAAPEDYAECDDAEDTDDYEDEHEEKPRPKFKKKKGKKAGNKTLILALSIGGLVLLLASGGTAAYFWLRTPNYQEPLAFVPANSTLIMTLDVEALIDQLGYTSEQLFDRSFKTGLGGPNPAKCKEETGLELKELFSQITFAFVTPVQQLAGAQAGRPADRKFVVVVKSKAAFKPEKIAKYFKVNDAPYKLGGKKYYKATDNTGDTDAFFIPSNRLFVFSNLPEKEFEAVLTADGNKLALPSELMSMINVVRPSVFWIAAPFDASLGQALQTTPGAMAASLAGVNVKALNSAMTGAKAMGLWAAVENNQVAVQAAIQFGDSTGASRMVGEMEQTWKVAKDMASASLKNLGDVPLVVKDALTELLNHTTIASKDNVAKVATHVNQDTAKKVVAELRNSNARTQRRNPAVANPAEAGAGVMNLGTTASPGVAVTKLGRARQRRVNAGVSAGSASYGQPPKLSCCHHRHYL